MPDPYPLIALLAVRGALCARDAAVALGIGEAELDALCGTASARGVGLESSGGTLRLDPPLTLFDPLTLAASIRARAPGTLHELACIPEVGSTNAFLAERARRGLPDGVVCLAEFQTEGRGRRGRTWLGQYGSSVTVSIHWGFPPGIRLEGLSLAVGVAVARALAEEGMPQVRLKWPNDVYARGRKAAGILVESGQRPGGGWYAVAGIGINVLTPARMPGEIDQPWIALDELVERPLDRQEVAGGVIAHVLRVLAGYARDGLGPLQAEWEALDLAADRPVRVEAGGEVICGVGRGIDATGALRVESNGVIRTLHSAEVSLRVSPDEMGAREGVRR